MRSCLGRWHWIGFRHDSRRHHSMSVLDNVALEPKVLLLDEPLAGLNSIEAARLANTVADVNRQGLTVVM